MLDFTAFSGCAGVVAGHPLDTLKVRQQSFSDSNLSRLTINLLKNEGVSDSDSKMVVDDNFGTYLSCFFGIRSQLCSRECLTQC